MDRQLEDCRDICEREGWQIVGPYEDNDTTAADPNKPRPAYDAMMADIRAGKIDVVVVSISDRLHREPSELEDFMKAARAAGMIRVRTDRRHNEYNLNDSRDRKDLRDEVNDAKYETDRISDRTKKAMLARARKGLPTGGSRAFGYEKDKVTINKPEAVLIREAAERILEGISLRAVTKDWNDRGIRSTKGNVFYDTQVKSILTSPRVAGLREHQGEIIGKAMWKPILDEAKWQQVCTILQDPARRQPRASQSYPLRGIAKCALCGQFLHANPRSDGRRYRCRKEGNIGCGGVSINADQFERFVFDLILPMADSPDLRDVLRGEEEGGAEKARQLVLANAEDDKILSDLSDMLGDGEIDRKNYQKQSLRLRERIEGRDTELASLRGRTALSRLGGDVQSGWQDMSAEDKRAIILSLVDRIEVGKATNLGSHNFDPDRVKVAYRTAAIQKMVRMYRGADGAWRVPTILFSTDPEQPLPETILRDRLLTPDEIKRKKRKGRPIPKSPSDPTSSRAS